MRVHGFDVLRGFSVISMVAFHLCYDLKFIMGVPLTWFAPPLQDIWRASISWTFVFIAGAMFAWSRDNFKRSMRYLLAAAVVFLVTTFIAVDVPISFGIIYCMGACTLSCWLLGRCSIRPSGSLAALLLFACFLVFWGLPVGHLGMGPLQLPIPRQLYATPWFSWLGLPGPHFASGDYYPLMPFLFLYLAGSAMGRKWRSDGVPDYLADLRSDVLELVGKHALPIYLLHQPLLFGALMLLQALGVL